MIVGVWLSDNEWRYEGMKQGMKVRKLYKHTHAQRLISKNDFDSVELKACKWTENLMS